MRKVHYKVVLDVFATVNDDIDTVEEIESMQFWPDHCDGIDIQDVTVESVEVSDSR